VTGRKEIRPDLDDVQLLMPHSSLRSLVLLWALAGAGNAAGAAAPVEADNLAAGFSTPPE